MNTTVFRLIPGWENHYKISDRGVVVSLPRQLTVTDRMGRTGTRTYQSKTLKSMRPRGRPYVYLCRPGEKVLYHIDELLIRTFGKGSP